MNTEIISGLNGLLSDAIIFRFKAQQRHWNIRGHHFFELHVKFEEQYNLWTEIIDELAERLRSLDATPPRTIADIFELAAIVEAPEETSEKDMAEGTITDFETMRNRMLAVSRKAGEAQDRSTENLLDPYIDYLSKQHWMFTAFLG